MEENQRFQEYAEYVLELKLCNGLKRAACAMAAVYMHHFARRIHRSTYERHLALLPKTNEAIGTMRLRDIRPMH